MPAAVEGAVIRVTAGGSTTEPTHQFADMSGGHLANLTANTKGEITASGDLKTATGNGVDDLAARLATVETLIDRVARLEAQVAYLMRNCERRWAS
jgi:hypothetical protein